MSRIRILLPAAFAAVALTFATLASAQSADPPNRVARLASLSGDVEFAPAGESSFGSADVNRPLITGDRLLTGSDGRAALELGDAALRINNNSAFNFLELNDTTAQVELSQGAVNLKLRRLQNGQTYEIDTPTAAFVANEPGTYRVDVDPSGNGAMVTVFEGTGTVYGENGASRPVAAGQSYRFDDPTLANVTVNGLPAPDNFDRFASARDSRYTNSVSRRYVSPDVIGYDDLDQYGDWQPNTDYGEVWYPNQVASDWAPYRDGHWAWIDPYGWTWVDNEPWGFAPFHYGRWAYVSNRWGWVPGPPVERAVYAPALVAFIGGSGLSLSLNIGGGGYDNGYGNGYDNGYGYNNGYGNGYGGGPVGWFPLGPRDIYVPPYRASRGYFDNINITNIRTVYVNKTVINNYYNGYAANRPYAGARYAYRNNPRAFTVVPRNVFAGARPVAPAVLRNIKPAMLAKATVGPPRIAPTNASLGIRRPAHPIATPVAKAFDRTVIARHAPPPPPVPFAAREKLIAKQRGAPLPVAQLREMRQARAKAQPQPQRVRVVAAARKPGAAPLPPMRPVAQAPRSLSNHGLPNPAHAATAIRPIEAPLNPSRPDATSRPAPMRPGELPSARFAHPQRNGNLPQAPAIRPDNPAASAAAERGKQRITPIRAANPQTVSPRAAPSNRENGFVHAPNAGPHAGPQAAPQANANANANVQQRADHARAQQQQAAQAQSKAAADQRAAQMQSRQAQQRADQAHAQQQQASQAQSKANAAQRVAQQHDAQARAAQQQAQQHNAQAQAAQQRADQARQQQQNADREQRAMQARQQQQQAQQRADQARQEQQRASQQQAQQRAMQQQAQQRAAQEQQRAAAAQQQAQMRDMQAQQAQQRAAQEQQRAAQMQHAPPQAAPQSQPQPRPPARKHKDEQQQNGGNRR
ncbi:MAG: DUF6600 domain-containing protein [Rhodanobacteraceae bacterium]